MLKQVSRRLTYANVVSTLGLFLVLTGGTAMAVNGSLPGQNTVGSADIINGEVKTTDLARPQAWREVAPGSNSQDLCADPNVTATFCSDVVQGGATPWQNFGSGFATAAFYKDQTGIVRFKGLVQTSALSGQSSPAVRPIFRLPAGYRPDTERVFASVGRNTSGQEVAAGRVDVQPNGIVALVQDCDANGTNCSANGGYVSLDGISFRPNG